MSSADPGIIVKRSSEEFAEWLSREWGFLMGLGSFDGEPIKLESYQLRFLQNSSKFRWVIKSRQIGFSFLFALEALVRCHLRAKHTAIFVSYNLDDAKEKILVARQVHEELPLAYQKRLIVDSKTELAFENNGQRKTVSRILSNPSKAPRGKHGDVYLDELAHYVNDREVYKGSTAIILRSNGQLTGASTPLGRRGIFWEIATEEMKKYPHHSRMIVPWWQCNFFCRDVKTAAEEAPGMPTEEAVRRFGMPALIEVFDSMALDDFEQEFCCKFLDETFSFYPYELILPACQDDLIVVEEPSSMRRSNGRLTAGFDVGRTKDRSELSIFEDYSGRKWCRLLKSFEGVPFQVQEDELRRLLNNYPIARFSIDRSGIGMHLAENLSRDFPDVVEEVQFTNENKERLAMDFKIQLQQDNIVLPKNRDLVSQIHSIKRSVTPSGKISYDADRTAKGGHADRFWASALACRLDRSVEKPAGTASVGVRVFG
jgi:phage FluMu gp28-like protein